MFLICAFAVKKVFVQRNCRIGVTEFRKVGGGGVGKGFGKAAKEIKPGGGRAQRWGLAAVGRLPSGEELPGKSSHVGGELIRLGTPAVLLLGLLKSVADVLRPSSSLVHFPHMA